MRKERSLPSAAIVAVVLVILSLAALASMERITAARRAALGGDFVDMGKIQAQMESGNLSSHEAEFYRTIEVELGY